MGTFEIDENSILTVSASDKGTGKKEAITITNDKGRLTKEEIDQMIADSEKYAEEDKAIKEKIDAKNQFENYIYQMKNSVEDKEKLAEKLADEDKSTIKDALTDAQDCQRYTKPPVDKLELKVRERPKKKNSMSY